MYAEGIGVLPNNSLLTSNEDDTFPMLQCLSGSIEPNMGKWIAPSGEDITYSTTVDPFYITVGGSSSPGSVLISQANGQVLTIAYEGVHTCIIPDEYGIDRYLLIGLYSYTFNGK